MVVPLLSSKEKALSVIFLAHGHFEILGEMPEKNTQNDERRILDFGVRLIDFWPERIRFSTPEKISPVRESAPPTFFYVQNAP